MSRDFVAAVIVGRAVAAYTATQSMSNDQMLDPTDGAGNTSGALTTYKGLLAYLCITAIPGGDTVNLQLQEQDPISGNYITKAATTAKATTGDVKLLVYPGVTEVAATQLTVEVGSVMPPKWRLRVVHSGAGSFTYSVTVMPLN